MSEREGVLIGRIMIEKYATADDVAVWVDVDDGQGDELALVDTLGLLAFAQALHTSRVDHYDLDEDDE